MFRHPWVAASARAGACAVAACGGASAAAHPPSTASPAAAQSTAAARSTPRGQPGACNPEHGDPGADAQASGKHHPRADRRRRPRDRRDLPRLRPVRPAQRQRRPRTCRVGAGARWASRDRRGTQPASRRVQRRVQAVGRRGRLHAGRTRDKCVAARLRQPGDRPVRTGQDRGLGQWTARAGRGRLLDINPEWVQLDAAGVHGGALIAEVPGQYRPSDQYLAGWTRDFFTVVAPPASPPPSARIRR
jgi:hypothetical protein